MLRINASFGLLATAAMLLSVPVFAAEPDAARLKSLEREIEQGRAEREKLQSQAQSVERSVATLRAQMVALAKDIQDQEWSITLLENRVAQLERDTQKMGEALKRRDAQMGKVLLALERLALRPGDALALSPLSPDDAVRTAILLRAAVPNIKASVTALQKDLADFYRARVQITEQREKVAAGAAVLLEKRMRLEKLMRTRVEQQTDLAARSDETDRRLAKVAQDAQDLRDLFAKLATEKTRREEEERKLATARKPDQPTAKTVPGAAPAQSGTAPSQANAQSPGAPIHEVAVTRSFAKARGTMPFPVAGSVASKYGESASSADDSGLRAKGITINARPGAQVVAPFDGIAAFAGPFRGYGQLLIIEHSEGYHTLLAGMGRIDIAVGQRVLAGEPVGVMNEGTSSSLYIELRRDGQPINPLPWLADRPGKNSG